MEVLTDVLMAFGVGVLGNATYTMVKVWKNFKPTQFSMKKFFGENKAFWVVCLVLNLVIVFSLVLIPDVAPIIEKLGFVVESGQSGYYWIGVLLASGTNNKLVAKKVEEPKP